MKKAEAIAMLKRIQEPEAWEPQINQAAFEALDMAIKALEQQPCEDTISRQAAKNKKVYSEERHEYVVPVAELDWLPSAQSEQRWIPWSSGKLPADREKRGEEMRKVARTVIDIVGALSLIGMVLLAVIATQTGYGQYRIGDR